MNRLNLDVKKFRDILIENNIIVAFNNNEGRTEVLMVSIETGNTIKSFFTVDEKVTQEDVFFFLLCGAEYLKEVNAKYGPVDIAPNITIN